MKKIEYRLFWISIFLGLIFWIADAVGDKLFSVPRQPFIHILLFNNRSFDFLLRPFVLLLFVTFALTATKLIRNIRESEGRYEQLFNNANDAIFLKPSIDYIGTEKFIEVNEMACKQLGYTREELLQLSPRDLTDPGSLGRLQEIMEELKTKGHSLAEIVILKKDGTKMPVEIHIREFNFNGAPVGLAIVRDLTERQAGEEALRESERQLRALTDRLLTAQEKERGRISKELHDELGQSLMFMKLELSEIKSGLPKRASGLREKCEHLLNYMEETADNVRRLSQELQPWELEEMGFSLASKMLIEEWCRLAGIKECILEVDEIDEVLSPGAQLNLYRILQESLTNIGKHAQATGISVTIKKQDEQVLIKIQDNGKGMDLLRIANLDDKEKGLGLSTIKERGRLMGGHLEIQSSPGMGTGITLTIPWRDSLSLKEK